MYPLVYLWIIKLRFTIVGYHHILFRECWNGKSAPNYPVDTGHFNEVVYLVRMISVFRNWNYDTVFIVFQMKLGSWHTNTNTSMHTYVRSLFQSLSRTHTRTYVHTRTFYIDYGQGCPSDINWGEVTFALLSNVNIWNFYTDSILYLYWTNSRSLNVCSLAQSIIAKMYLLMFCDVYIIYRRISSSRGWDP